MAAYGVFFNAEATVDTLKYQVDTQENVTEVGRTQGQAVLNSMSFVVNNQYGLPEWGNFTVKRNEVKDADEVKFVEGIRNGAPANTLNKNMYCKKSRAFVRFQRRDGGIPEWDVLCRVGFGCENVVGARTSGLALTGNGDSYLNQAIINLIYQ